MNASMKIWMVLVLSLLATYTKQCLAFSPTLRGNTNSNNDAAGGRAIENDTILVEEQAQVSDIVLEEKRNLSTQSSPSSSNATPLIKKETKEENEEQMERQLAGETVARLFSTPVAQWTLEQWGLLFILIWLAGWFLRRCPCITDLLACFCCYELFCDDHPAGFVAC